MFTSPPVECHTHLHVPPLEYGGEDRPQTETGHFIQRTQQLGGRGGKEGETNISINCT